MQVFPCPGAWRVNIRGCTWNAEIPAFAGMTMGGGGGRGPRLGMALLLGRLLALRRGIGHTVSGWRERPDKRSESWKRNKFLVLWAAS